MEFLRKMARESGMGFKELADEVWAEVGDVSAVKSQFKGMEKSAGKYALTAQLLMTLNFPDDAETFRSSFNVTGKGPTGADGFSGTSIGDMLNGVSEVAAQMNAAAIGTSGAADISQTSTYDDLGKLIPRLRTLSGDK